MTAAVSSEVGLELRVAPVGAELAALQDGEVQGEARAAEEHEHGGDRLDAHAVEMLEAGIVGREARGGHGAERMCDRIEEVHADDPVGRDAGDGQRQVDRPERLRRLRDARRQLVVLHRARRLRLVERHAADAEDRQDRDGQHDDAHAAEPLDLLAVIEDGLRQLVEADDDRRSRGREAGHGLEHGIREREVRHVAEEERRRAGEAEENPEHGDDQEAVAQAEVAARLARGQPQQDAGRGDDHGGDQERLPVAIRVDEGNGDRRQHRQAEDHQHEAEDPLRHAEIHGRMPAWNSRPTSSTWRRSVRNRIT